MTIKTNSTAKKRNFSTRRLFYLFTVLCLAASLLIGAAGCKEPVTEEPTDIFEIIDFPVPENLPDYALKVEWLGENGEAIAFNPYKPVMILFNGISRYDIREDMKLDSEIYYYSSQQNSQGALSYNARELNKNLSYYWRKVGFNVGVFHYENFADDTVQNLHKKIYDSSAMTYIDKDGNAVIENLPDYTLTEAFVMEWLELMKAQPIKGSVPPNRGMEVRFVGNSAGANLAVSAAEYLYDLYGRGHIDGFFVPNRVSLINPYLNNTAENITLSYREAFVSSALEYNSGLVAALAQKGVVFDMVESDKEFYNSYEQPYSGLVEIEDESEEEGDGEEGEGEDETPPSYTLGDTGDCLLYKTIQECTAYLTLSESYSDYYTEEYKALDRAALDWYLYSVNGSDETSVGNSTINGPADTRPMMDDRIGSSSSIPRYSVSAWTPTPFIRALRGVKFEMHKKTYDYTIGEYVAAPYTLARFEAENNQISDFEGVTVQGYVYWRRDESNYINYGANTRLANVEVRIMIELDSTATNTVTLKTTTGQDGFYSITIDPQYFDKTIKITVKLPSREFIYGGIPTDTTEYTKMTMTAIKDTDNGISVTSTNKKQIIIRNCGLIKSGT